MLLTDQMVRMTTLMELRAEEREMVVAEEGRDIEGHTGREVYMCRPRSDWRPQRAREASFCVREADPLRSRPRADGVGDLIMTGRTTDG